MPDGLDASPQESTTPSESNMKPLDGVLPPQTPEESSSNDEDAQLVEEQSPEAEEVSDEDPQADMKRKKLLLMILIGAGAFLLFYIVFAGVLMAKLPSPDGGGEGLRAFGNLIYGVAIFLVLTLLALLVLRFVRMELEPPEILQRIMRPAIGASIIIVIAVVVIATINRELTLPIDLLEPKARQNLTAPITVTFGTDSLRNILRKSGLAAVKYHWDFNGDGRTDATTSEAQVTTIYTKKGVFPVRLNVLVSNGKTRTAAMSLVIQNVLFSFTPDKPIRNQEVTFDMSNIVSDPTLVKTFLWDFNADGEVDATVATITQKHIFETTGTHQVNVKVQYANGLVEDYTRAVTILEKREQPFAVSIQTEGAIKGVAPLGVMFDTTVEEGISVRSVQWLINENPVSSEQRFPYTFDKNGEYAVRVIVTDTTGKVAEDNMTVSVLESLSVRDLVISGTPQPSQNSIRGKVPLEVRLTPKTSMPFITFVWEQENASRVVSHKGDYYAVYQEAGTYPLVLIASDAEGRTQRFSYSVIVDPPLTSVLFTAVPPTGIAPLTVKFDASQSLIPDQRITGYAWLFGDEEGTRAEAQLLGAQVTHRYEKEGTYIVVVRALTESGQSFEARKTIVVRLPSLDACFFPSRTSGPAPLGVRLYASCSTGNIRNYQWTFGDGASSESVEETVDHVFSKSGTYEITLEITDDKGNVSTTSASISVSQP